MRNRSGLGCAQVTGLADRFCCRCTYPVMSPAAKSFSFRSCLASLKGHSWELEQPQSCVAAGRAQLVGRTPAAAL